ncbi:MAG: type II toxin-antitoxin system ParD family antitoxin [Gulosibacter sp.]|uniref:type II toxin-antitoxin system ParD family antitoxin n=1 Tax=Gulosibacter sp. TaxID=2817531 RepID=UPI003F905BD6
MATRNVVLSQHQHEFVEEMVRSGRYQNASEVLRDGLRLIERRELEDAAKLAALRDAADKGWKDIDNGHFADVEPENLEEFIAQLGSEGARMSAN